MVGEPLMAPGGVIPAQEFTLTGTNITALEIDSNNGGITNLSGVPIEVACSLSSNVTTIISQGRISATYDTLPCVGQPF